MWKKKKRNKRSVAFGLSHNIEEVAVPVLDLRAAGKKWGDGTCWGLQKVLAKNVDNHIWEKKQAAFEYSWFIENYE